MASATGILKTTNQPTTDQLHQSLTNTKFEEQQLYSKCKVDTQ